MGAFMQQSPNFFESISSEDTLYLRKKCAEWLIRGMQCKQPLVPQIIDLLSWILGRPPVELTEKAHAWLASPKAKVLPMRTRDILQDAIAEARDNPSLVSESLSTAMEHGPRALLREFGGVINVSLDNYLRKQKYKGGSGIESCAEKLKELFGLSVSEVDLCLLLYTKQVNEFWEHYFEDGIGGTRSLGRDRLCQTLGITMRELRVIFSGKLMQLGIVDPKAFLSLEGRYESFLETGDADALTKDLFKVQEGRALPLSYYALDPSEVEHIRTLLAGPCSTPTHFLLYGTPGTGKSSFAHSLGEVLGLETYRVATSRDSDMNQRRAAIEACLNITGNGSAGLVVVDEADNLLNTQMPFFSRGQGQDKGWLNELLDRPGLRIIWITNDIGGIEPSVLRRFAYSVHFRPLNLKQRVRLWATILKKNKSGKLLRAEQIGVLAKQFNLSAGCIDLAVKKALESAGRTPARFRSALEMSLKASQTLLNDGQPVQSVDRLDQAYSLEGINLSGRMDEVLGQLERFDQHLRAGKGPHANMNLLLYGPPGTGKTELAKYIARHLDRELVIRRASELLGPYVGMTERSIAQAFREAEEEGAVLLIDEADSFLFDRGMAFRSWEVTAVNEFLTRMERFHGLLICTTNRMGKLDGASLRRFNHKLELGYLKFDGCVTFYKRMLAPLVKRPLRQGVLERVRGTGNLTPGDFRIVRDRFSFYSGREVRHDDLIGALLEESAIKSQQDGKRAIGFIGPARE